MIGFIPKSHAPDAILAVFAVKAVNKVQRCRAILAERAVRKFFAIGTLIAIFGFPCEIGIDAILRFIRRTVETILDLY